MSNPLGFGMALVISLLAAFDASLTEKRILKYGLEVELNPIIRWITQHIGLQVAIALGIMIPTLGISSLFAGLGWNLPLAAWLGAKALMARYQVLSLKIEAEMDRYRAAAKVASSRPSEDSHPGDVQ